jgi:hypothetical protein
LARTSEERKPLGKYGLRRENNIKLYLEEIKQDVVD